MLIYLRTHTMLRLEVFVDEVITPSQTREKLIKAFSMLRNKVDHLTKKKHGNIPYKMNV